MGGTKKGLASDAVASVEQEGPCCVLTFHRHFLTGRLTIRCGNPLHEYTLANDPDLKLERVAAVLSYIHEGWDCDHLLARLGNAITEATPSSTIRLPGCHSGSGAGADDDPDPV